MKKLYEFFKPNFYRIVISILLLGILMILTLPPICYIIFPFYFPMLLFHNFPLYSLPVFILIAYIFSCYSTKGKAIKGIAFFLITLSVISMVVVFLIWGYNKAFGYSCSNDSDCIFRCGAGGAVNKKYISLRDPFILVDCRWGTAICENNQCKTLTIEDIKSPEECERFVEEEPSLKDYCYYYFAKSLSEVTLCEKINDKWLKEECKKEVVGGK